jgi:hypothetical protein
MIKRVYGEYMHSSGDPILCLNETRVVDTLTKKTPGDPSYVKHQAGWLVLICKKNEENDTKANKEII